MVSAQMIPQTRLTDEAEDIFKHLGDNGNPLVVSLDGCPAVVIQDYERYEKISSALQRL
jgi:PHD/YefM family antitoxin component YafN of YafNO toxin-antitoxin module